MACFPLALRLICQFARLVDGALHLLLSALGNGATNIDKEKIDEAKQYGLSEAGYECVVRPIWIYEDAKQCNRNADPEKNLGLACMPTLIPGFRLPRLFC